MLSTVGPEKGRRERFFWKKKKKKTKKTYFFFIAEFGNFPLNTFGVAYGMKCVNYGGRRYIKQKKKIN